MRELAAVFASDEVTRNFMKFPASTLAGALEQGWMVGRPMFIGHDLHGLAGWSQTRYLYFEPGLTRLAGVFYLPETPKEEQDIRRLAAHAINERLTKVAGLDRPSLENRIRPHLSGAEAPGSLDCVSLVSTDLARKVFPDLFRTADKDALVPVRTLTPVAPGVYEREGLLVFAHQYFRRSLSRLNTLNVPFLQLFQSLMKRSDLDLKIALDPDMIGLGGTLIHEFEMQYWWGPHFSDDLPSISPGVTVHTNDSRARFFSGVDGAQFRWHHQGNQYVFECEEIRDSASLGVGRHAYGCRYTHSLLPVGASGSPNHLDGAIRLYDEESMISRTDRVLGRAGKAPVYVKLWRIDGDIPVPVWKEILTHYYRDNVLIGEYLGAKEQRDTVPVDNPEPDKTGTALPFFSSGMSIRATVSFAQTCERPDGRKIIPVETVTLRGTTRQCVDNLTVELCKALRRYGEVLDLPSDAILVDYADGATSFPPVMHTGDTPALLAATRNAIRDLCEAWARDGDDRTVSYVLGVKGVERDIWYSFVGHVQDLLSWLRNPLSVPPSDRDCLAKWSEGVAAYLQEAPHTSDHWPPLTQITNPAGMILARKFMNPADVDIAGSKEGIEVTFRDEHRIPIVLGGSLGVNRAMWVKTVECSKCGGDYRVCNCSAVLDRGVTAEVRDTEFLGLVWTKK